MSFQISIQMKRFIAVALTMALLLSLFGLGAETMAAAGKTFNVKVSLSGTKSLSVKLGKKNVKKKTITVQKGDKISFSHTKNKEVKFVTYKSISKKIVTITKKGKATAEKAGTAKIKINVKRKKGKAISTWVKIKVKENRGTEDNNLNPSPTPDSPSDTPETISPTEMPTTSIEPSTPSTKPSTAASSLTTNGGAIIPLSSLQHRTEAEDAPMVYYISDITPESLMKVYNALGWTPYGKVAVKLSTGEPPASNYLDPNLIKDLVQSVSGTVVECNTAYGGDRSSTAMHYQVAKDHGFTEIADFQILDEDGSMSIPVENGTRLKENFVGKAFDDYDSYLVLSHFKGHAMAGYGGAIKNISIGIASSEGKAHIHSGGTGGSMWGGSQDAFLEAMGDAGKSVSDYLGSGERIAYINVMNRLSIDCDCDGNPAEPDMHDIGILASSDPVALDQACIDLVWVSKGNEAFVNRVKSRNGLHTLENAEAVGLGSRSYQLEDVGK